MNLPTPTLGLAGWTLAIGLAVGAAGGWRITSWVNQGHELKAVRTALSAAQAQYQKRIDTLTQQVKDGQDASKTVIDELAALRARPQPRDPVRLCVRTPSAPAVREAPASATGVPSAFAGAGLVPGRAGADFREGQDIAPDLNALARRADELLAICRGAQRLLPR